RRARRCAAPAPRASRRGPRGHPAAPRRGSRRARRGAGRAADRVAAPARAEAAVIAALLAVALLLPDGGQLRVEATQVQVALGRRFEFVVSGPLEADATLTAPPPPDGLLADAPRLVDESGHRTLHWPLRAVREGDFVLRGLAVKNGATTEALPEL